MNAYKLAGLRVGIVGGSLVGCAAAASLERLGADVTVLERSTGGLSQRGSSLGMPTDLTQRLKERDLLDRDMPGMRLSRRLWVTPDEGYRAGRLLWEQPFEMTVNNWRSLFANFRGRVADDAYLLNTKVEGIQQVGGTVTVGLPDGKRKVFDLLIGADGYKSDVRSWQFPGTRREYAGHVAWRGWARAADLDLDVTAIPKDCVYLSVFDSGHAGFWWSNGVESADPADHEITWIFYDTLGAYDFPGAPIDDDGVPIAIRSGGLNAAQTAYLHRYAKGVLPPLLAELVCATSNPLMAPIADVRIESMVNRRTLLLGDAAAVLRPVTSSGLTKGLEDVMMLVDLLQRGEGIDETLARFNEERMRSSDRIQSLGIRMADAMINDTPRWGDMSSADMSEWFTGTANGVDWFALPGRTA